MESPDKGSAFLMDKRVSIQKAGSQLRNKTRTQFQNSTKRSYCRFKIMCEHGYVRLMKTFSLKNQSCGKFIP